MAPPRPSPALTRRPGRCPWQSPPTPGSWRSAARTPGCSSSTGRRDRCEAGSRVPGVGSRRGRGPARLSRSRELRRWRRCGGLWDDVLAQAMVAGEHAVVAGHVEAGWRDQGAEAGEELVGVHVGVGDAAAPRGLEGHADAAAGERRDGVVGEGRAQEIAADSPWAACGRDRRRWSRRGDSCRRRRGSSAAARTVSRARGAGRRARAARRRPARGRCRGRRRANR